MPDWAVFLTAPVEAGEAFFGVSFWRQFVGVLVGAFLAVAGGLAVQAFLLARRRGQTARMARNTIAMEVLRHLETLGTMEELTQQTSKEPPPSGPARIVDRQPNPAILRQFVSPDIISALSPDDHRFLLTVIGNLEHLNARYESWVRTLTSSQEMMVMVQDSDSGTVKPYWEAKTDTLLWTIGGVRNNLLSLLIGLCKKASAPLVDDEAERVRALLEPIKLNEKSANFYRQGKSSIARKAGFEDPNKYLVVWEHDWPECPLRVIELRSRGGEGEEGEA